MYKKLKAIEDNQGPEVSEKYFLGLLEEEKINYDSFILSILNTSESNLELYFSLSDKEEEQEKKEGFYSHS